MILEHCLQLFVRFVIKRISLRLDLLKIRRKQKASSDRYESSLKDTVSKSVAVALDQRIKPSTNRIKWALAFFGLSILLVLSLVYFYYELTWRRELNGSAVYITKYSESKNDDGPEDHRFSLSIQDKKPMIIGFLSPSDRFLYISGLLPSTESDHLMPTINIDDPLHVVKNNSPVACYQYSGTSPEATRALINGTIVKSSIYTLNSNVPFPPVYEIDLGKMQQTFGYIKIGCFILPQLVQQTSLDERGIRIVNEQIADDRKPDYIKNLFQTDVVFSMTPVRDKTELAFSENNSVKSGDDHERIHPDGAVAAIWKDESSETNRDLDLANLGIFAGVLTATLIELVKGGLYRE